MFQPICKKRVSRRCLNAIDRLRRGPHFALGFRLNLRVARVINIHPQDIARRLEHIVKQCRGYLHQFEVRLFLRHARHIGSKHGTHSIVQGCYVFKITASVVGLQLCLAHLFELVSCKRCIRDNYQTLIN